jgi:hypothetical protein
MSERVVPSPPREGQDMISGASTIRSSMRNNGSRRRNGGGPRSSMRNNGRRRRNGGGPSGYTSTVPSFKGLNEKVSTLGTKLERKDHDQFPNFRESLKFYMLSDFEHPSDIIILLTDNDDPMKSLMRDKPTKRGIIYHYDITLTGDDDDDEEMIGTIDILLAARNNRSYL